MFSSQEGLIMGTLQSDFATAHRRDFISLDDQMGYYCPCANCGGCHAGVCGVQVRVILWALGATAVTVVMFVLALMGVIR